MIHRRIALAGALLVLAAGPAAAQGYPVKPVRVVVPFAAGGSTDIIGRTLAVRLTESLGQTVVVDNRAGGGTVIGTEIVARSAPDGHTLLVVPAPFTINPSLLPKLPYDPLNDFTPITLINTTPLVVVVNPSVPARSVKELIALARAKPGVLNFGSSGTGGSNHLAGELFNAMAGVKMVHVPYKGNAPALTDLVGGHVDLVFNGLTSAYPLLKAGKIRPLAVTSSKRSGVLPELPTLDEEGLKGFEAVAWNGLAGPARLPKEVVDRLSAEVARILGNAEMRERLRAEGSDPVGSSPQAFATFLRDEIAKWKKVITTAKVKP
ncbi:MAG: tripartite tricarboxylate transporter substrate binding protein [Burkholderiales bacterium]|nr:tripartite tricarboxylate transporter substrate binding protein [Burkholderiales bacterium]